MTALDVDAIDVRYGDFQALYGVSLRVAAGQTLALVGANGAGKTTLLRAIAGALPPAAGRIRYGAADLTSAPPHERIRRGIVLVPEGRRLFASLTAEENVRVGAAAAHPARRGLWPLDRLYAMFPLVASVRGRRAALLSGGEQQAVAIARALASGPSLLLLDEVSLGLAPRVVEDLYVALRELRAAGTAMLLVEQDLDRALAVCDEVVCLLEGRVALRGAAAATRRDDVVAAYFGQGAAGVGARKPGAGGRNPGVAT